MSQIHLQSSSRLGSKTVSRPIQEPSLLTTFLDEEPLFFFSCLNWKWKWKRKRKRKKVAFFLRVGTLPIWTWIRKSGPSDFQLGFEERKKLERRGVFFVFRALIRRKLGNEDLRDQLLSFDLVIKVFKSYEVAFFLWKARETCEAREWCEKNIPYCACKPILTHGAGLCPALK